MDKSHLTAMKRKDISLPAKWLQSQGLLRGKILDYGCGYGFDADNLPNAVGYDPFFRPDLPEGKFDTILCAYVLNVIYSHSEKRKVIEKIINLLNEGGKAYITVRRNIKKSGWTKIGTWQTQVYLTYPSIKKTSTYEIYEISK